MHALLVLAAAAAQAPDGPTPFRESVSAAVFELCPGLRSGRVSIDDAAALAGRGFRRQPGGEAMLARVSPERGRPYMLVAGSEENSVVIAYWPRSHFCNLTFTGAEAEQTMAGLEARMTSDRSTYQALPRNAFRATLGDHPTLISLYRPAADDQSRSFNVTLQPAN